MEDNTKKETLASMRTWLMEPRPQYLLLPVILVFLGTVAAGFYDGIINVWHAIIAMIGLVMCHMSVNILNDYCDFKSGVDLKTIKTPFNGGSGILPAGLMKPKQALWYGIICLLLAVPIGVYFVWLKGWMLLPLLALGALCIVLYTPLILKIDFPEWSPGLGLGVLPVLGAYFVQTGLYSTNALIASIPSGLLVLNLLLLNEFPDVEADKIANKRTLPIRIGIKGAAIVYTIVTLLTYAWIVLSVILGWMPVWTLLGLLTLPLAIKAIQGSFQGHDFAKIVPAMGSNVLVVLGTQFLMVVGFLIAILVK
ncbi:MAG: prenyltransferase [Caldisericia bacterium]|nr:prenyltransferase [Caldisericia bacterium]